jgi:outer membrane protein assembly factor BamB
LASAALSGACSSRNLRKHATFPNAPVDRFLTYGTRTEFPNTGEDPVEFASPVITENNYIIPSETRGIEARDRNLQSLRWRMAVAGGVSSQPLYDADTVYFGGNDGQFYALDADLGSVKWKYETKAPVYAQAAVQKGRIYFQASDDVLYCLEQETGRWVWHYKRTISASTTVRGNGVPLIDRDRVLIGFSDGYFAALNAKDGNLLWETRIQRNTKFMDVDAEAVVDGNQILIPSYDGGLYALSRDNGRVLWFTDVGGSKKVLLDDAEGSKSLYLPTSDGRILSMNRETGKVNWAFELDLGTPTNIIDHGIYLVFGSSRQYLYIVRKGDGGLVYRFNVGLRSGFFGSPVESPNGGDEFFLYSNFGNLYGWRWRKENPKALKHGYRI